MNSWYQNNKIRILEKMKKSYREKHPKIIDNSFNPDIEKRCGKCDLVKNLDEFYYKKNKTGKQNWCKECCSTSGKKYRKEHQDYIYNYLKQYYDTEKGKEVAKRKTKNMQEKYPEKYKARMAVHHAVERNIIPSISSKICSICNSNQARQYHHHMGYEKENYLNVIPVCIQCHNILDKNQDAVPK